MSLELISRSPDLQRLVDAGYEVSVQSGHLVVNNIPYVTPTREVGYGALVSELTLGGDRTAKPATHVIMFTGEYAPCQLSGQRIEAIYHNSAIKQVAEGLVVRHSFSNKPPDGYNDYFEKVESYATIISGPAEALDQRATAKTFRPSTAAEDSPFNYPETASGRAGITEITKKLEGHHLGIVGLGGTGAYVLDFVAKTPVHKIHLYDFDVFCTHNAFRAPGAPSLDQLRQGPTKVEYLHSLYSKMHRGIVPHETRVDESNVSDLLDGLGFVFVCVDDGAAKKPIVEYLEGRDVSFVDVGMGIEATDGKLGGIIRTTTSVPGQRDHFRQRVGMQPPEEDDAYSTNIQIAELNAFNAVQAVMRWKKLTGFYRDLERECSSTYSTDVNQLLSADQPCA